MSSDKIEKNSENMSNSVWRNSANRIKILNPKDFVIPDFVSVLSKEYGFDVNSLGLTNAEEIKSRLEIMRILMDQSTRRKFKDFLDFFKRQTSLPMTENDFLLQYQNNKSLFWEGLKKFSQFISDYESAASIKSINEKIKSNSYLQEKEELLSVSISKRLTNVAFLEGVVKMKFDTGFVYRQKSNVIDSVIVGKKEFNATWGSEYVANIPKWTKTPLMSFIGVKGVVQNIKNKYAKKMANYSSVVKDLPHCIVADIEKFFYQEQYYKVLEQYKRCNFMIHFTYTSNGLVLDFVGLENEDKYGDFSFEKIDFGGFTKVDRMKFSRQSHKITEMYNQSYKIKGLRPIYDKLQDSFSLFSRHFSIPSPLTDVEFKWYALRNLYEEEKILVDQLRDIRRYILNGLYELKKLSDIVAYMQNVAEKRNLNLCIPEITETGSGTTFKDLAPIEIFSKSNELTSFTLSTINKQTMCLTGRHGGGKSVAGKSILSSVFLAQSGLPIFAKEFKTEIKTVIGSIVNDEGEGSTANIFLDKLLSLFQGIDTVPKEESIIFIDEIGKGTQESSGIQIGKDMLNAFKEKQYSVIFNTQILELAEFAQHEIGSRCFVVDKFHKFKEGVGGGQLNELILEKGLDKYLKVEKVEIL